MDGKTLRQLFERALAYAHAALDEPTSPRLERARAYAGDALGTMDRTRRRAWTLGEARQLVTLASQLRAVLAAIERTIGAPLLVRGLRTGNA